MGRIIHIVTGVADKWAGQEMVEVLLSEKLIACAHIHQPHEAHYRWEGKVVVEPEILVTLKTLPHLVENVKKRVRGLHPYQVPYIAITDWDVENDYLKWIQENIIYS